MTYWPIAMDDDAAPFHQVHVARETLLGDLDDIRGVVDRLTQLALLDRGRGDIGIETAARRLGRHLLPGGSMETLLTAGFHPRLESGPDLASAIPWELVEGVFSDGAAAPLSLRYHLSHLGHYLAAERGCNRDGRSFLLVQDPTADLTSKDPTPDQLCRSHAETLADWLREAGYEVDILTGDYATRARFRDAIQKPGLAGLYFFGHGCFPRNAPEGLLRLSDGDMVTSALDELGLSIPFVFLNACEGAALGREWGLETRSGNVASAFARRRGRTVIAPLWPVVNHQAARAALEFFSVALKRQPVARAMSAVREASHREYLAGRPELAWLAYRFYGNPNHRLALDSKPVPVPVPSSSSQAPSVPSVSAPDPAPASRTVDAAGRLDVDAFAFDLEGVLLRAAKRMHWQDRRLASPADLLAGLIRRGDLTRGLLQGLSIDADELYNAWLEVRCPGVDEPASEASPVSAGDADDSTDGVTDSWLLHTASQFTREAWSVLTEAGAGQASESGSGQPDLVSERDVLLQLLKFPLWGNASGCDLPSAPTLRRLLDRANQTGGVDANGAVVLSDLDASAREIISVAHLLAQYRQLNPIPHRALLAAMVWNVSTFASRLARRQGADPERLLAVMLALSQSDKPQEEAGQERAPETPGNGDFGLTPEACSRIIIPVLREARRRVPPGGTIGEEALVRAFCSVADAGFREAVLALFPGLDLAVWSDVSQSILELAETLTPEAWRVIQQAAQWTRTAGRTQIAQRTVLAAFLRSPESPVVKRLGLSEADRSALGAALLGSAPPATPSGPTVDPFDRIIRPMLERLVKDPSKGPFTELDLFQAFCEVADQALRLALEQSPWRIRLSTLPTGELPATPSRTDGAGVGTPSGAAGGASGISNLPESMLAEPARAVLIRSAELTRRQAGREVRTPHLWAALIGESTGPFGPWLQRHGLPSAVIQSGILALTPPPAGSTALPNDTVVQLGANVLEAIRCAHELARSAGRSEVTVDDLARTLVADTRHPVNTLLSRLGLDLRTLPGGQPGLGGAPPRWSSN